MLEGSCACGLVRYELHGALVGPVSHCHCWQCRKHSGASFGTTGVVKAAELVVVAGEERLASWESSPGIHRVFAGCCGSPLFKRRDALPGLLGLRLGSLDSDPARQVERHIYVSSKAPWVELHDGLPQEEGGAPFPEREAAPVAAAIDPASTAVPGGGEIRLAGVADLERVRALVAAFRDHLEASTPSDAELARSLPPVLSDPSIEFACAFSGGEAVAYTQTRFFRSLWAPGSEALLEDLFVLPAARGRGIGRALLRNAIGRARRRGARLLALTTNERNEAAQGLYRSEGLRPQAAKRWGGGREIRWIAELGDA